MAGKVTGEAGRHHLVPDFSFIIALSVIRRWHFRQGIAIREIKRRTGLSRNTIRKYLLADAVKPVFKVPDRPSKLPVSTKPVLASTTFIVGEKPLTPAAVRLIIKRAGKRAADEYLVTRHRNPSFFCSMRVALPPPDAASISLRMSGERSILVVWPALRSGLRSSLRSGQTTAHTGHHSCRRTGQDNRRLTAARMLGNLRG